MYIYIIRVITLYVISRQRRLYWIPRELKPLFGTNTLLSSSLAPESVPWATTHVPVLCYLSRPVTTLEPLIIDVVL